MKPIAALYFACVASLIALIFLGLAWELWLAPLRPGGLTASGPMASPLSWILTKPRRATHLHRAHPFH